MRSVGVVGAAFRVDAHLVTEKRKNGGSCNPANAAAKN